MKKEKVVYYYCVSKLESLFYSIEKKYVFVSEMSITVDFQPLPHRCRDDFLKHLPLRGRHGHL
jgi:hypothetical protein